MIDKIIKAINANLNQYLRLKLAVNQREEKVVTNNLVNQDGSTPADNANKIVCSLVNFEQEKVLSGGSFTTSGNSAKNAPINLYLYLMYTSAYQDEQKNYLEGIRMLSYVIGFFQGKQVFTPQNTPDLPSGVQKITFNIFSTDMGNLSNMWGTIGAKYMPSMLYQVRLITIFEDLMLNEVSDVKGFDTKM